MLGPDVSWHGVKDGWFAAAMNDFGDLFDIVTVHWYADGPELAMMMDQLVRPLSLGKPVWMTEVGMKPCASLFGEAGQALLYQRVLSAFQERRSWWTGVLFYDLYELPVGARLRHRDHPRRLVEPAGVPAVSGVHQATPWRPYGLLDRLDPLVDRHLPVDVRRFDGDVVPARALGRDLFRAAAGRRARRSPR